MFTKENVGKNRVDFREAARKPLRTFADSECSAIIEAWISDFRHLSFGAWMKS